MTARKKIDIPVDESQVGSNVQLKAEKEIAEWRNKSPVERTRAFIKWCREQKSAFTDPDFFEHAKSWVEIFLLYEDTFSGPHAEDYWDNNCADLLHKILDKEQNSELETAVKDGATQGNYTFSASSDSITSDNFSSILWLLGLAEQPSVITADGKKKITLINQGKLVFVQLKNSWRVGNFPSIPDNTAPEYSTTIEIKNINVYNITDNTDSSIVAGASDHASVTQTTGQPEES